MNLKKLDRRMNGYGNFLYVVDYMYRPGGLRNFVEVRKWCTDTFGPSVELDIWEDFDDLKNPKWSWERGEFGKSYRCRIFIADEKTASLFSLRWS